MLCNFCGREVNNGASECPYCHYVFLREVTILTDEERDTFEGTTIEDDGRVHDREDDYRDSMRDRAERTWNNGFRVYQAHSSGCLGSLLGLAIFAGLIMLGLAILPYVLLMCLGVAAYVWFKRRF